MPKKMSEESNCRVTVPVEAGGGWLDQVVVSEVAFRAR